MGKKEWSYTRDAPIRICFASHPWFMCAVSVARVVELPGALLALAKRIHTCFASCEGLLSKCGETFRALGNGGGQYCIRLVRDVALFTCYLRECYFMHVCLAKVIESRHLLYIDGIPGEF